MTGKKNVLESYFNPVTKNINIGDDLFVFLHELGHAKDAQNQKGFFNKLVGDGRIFTNDKDIQKLSSKNVKHLISIILTTNVNMFHTSLKQKVTTKANWADQQKLQQKQTPLQILLPTEKLVAQDQEHNTCNNTFQKQLQKSETL